MENRQPFRSRVVGRKLLGALLVLAVIAGALLVSTAGSAQTATPLPNRNRLYFDETGQSISGAILTHWLTTLKADVEATGMPVTPAVDLHGRTVQWFEYDRFEINGKPLTEATAEDVHRAPIGRLYADKLGYTRWIKAFAPIDAASTEARYFYETRHSIANAFLGLYELEGNEARLGAPISEEFRMGEVTYQFFEYGALAYEPETGPRIIPLGKLDAAINGYGGVDEESAYDAVVWNSSNMLLLSNLFAGERWIEVDLSEYTLTAYVGERPMLTSKVVVGPPQSPTPVGEFEIYIRHEVQDLSGIGWDGQPYYSPGTPWVMYFYEDFGFHGSTWRDSYGFADGQGCVVPPNDVAELLWKWADYGTRVVIKE